MTEESLLFTPLDIQNEKKSHRALGEFQCTVTTDLHELDQTNDELFSEHAHGWLLSIVAILASLSLSVFAILPYTVYQRQLLISDWILFCVVRPGMYLLVFCATWHKLFTRKNSYWGRWRVVVSCVFAGVYTSLYTIKWVEADGIPLRYLSLSCLSVSWFAVFYEVMDRHLSSRSAATSIELRRKTTLLYAIRQQELACWRVPNFASFVSSALQSEQTLSVLVCSHSEAHLHGLTSEDAKLSIYEAAAYDQYERPIATLVSVAMGLSFILLTLALIEDYAYAFFRLVRNEDVFLVLVFLFCVIFSALYLLSTYPIYHRMLGQTLGLVRDPRETIFSFCRRTPLFVLASIAGLTRMNASYSIFGSIAGRMGVPEGIGLFLVWLGVMIVALVDFSSTLKIVSRTVKYVWMMLLFQVVDVTWTPSWMRDEIDRAIVRYYSKRLKRVIRNSNESELSYFIGRLL